MRVEFLPEVLKSERCGKMNSSRAREGDAGARRKKKAMGSGESELLAHPGHHIYSPLGFDLGAKWEG